MSYLKQNSKMRKAGVKTYNFGVPAGFAQDGTKTCPNAKFCLPECYARNGRYRMPVVKDSQHRSLELAKNSAMFYMVMSHEIQALESRAKKKGHKLAIRTHDSGDMFSRAHFETWIGLALAFPNVVFYGYTKQVKWVHGTKLPKNMKMVLSYGGTEDEFIGPRDRHSLVFPSREAIKKAGYVDATDDDSLAWQSRSKKIGLLYRGRKNFVDTPWAKVYQSVIKNKTRSK